MKHLQKIDVTPKVNEFKNYLQSADRIILSAKFGDGKTCFLKEATDQLKSEYVFYTVYPINYSVAKDEDVFEYIKRDIILQMNKREMLPKIAIEAFFESVKAFVDISSVVSFLLSFIPNGKFIENVLERFNEAKVKYNTEKITADKYLSTFQNQKGSIYEDDGYTQLIKAAIKWNHERPEDKPNKAVLIIEDLDRLDPQHLFRILNVLSAHIDDNTTSDNKFANKFGFDNIVLVMDYETTEHIFHHFYGLEANYVGYMSKFLACEPFRYSIKNMLKTSLIENIKDYFQIKSIFEYMTKFKDKIDHFSIRDMERICEFEPSSKIKNKNITFGDRKISTSLPIVHLILFMIECGLSLEEIIDDLTFKSGEDGTQEYLQTIYPLYYIFCENGKNQKNTLSYTKTTDTKVGLANQYTALPLHETAETRNTNVVLNSKMYGISVLLVNDIVTTVTCRQHITGEDSQILGQDSIKIILKEISKGALSDYIDTSSLLLK